MRITRLFILVLSFIKPLAASAQLAERQEQGFWPDFGDIGDGLTYLRGLGDLFQEPQSPDSWTTKPPPTTDTTSDKKASPESPELVPDSPPSSDTSSPAGPLYKIKINDNQSPVPLQELEPNPPTAPLSINEECDPLNINNADCSKTTDQLIFTTSCANIDPDQEVSAETKAQNQAIQDALAEMNDQNIQAGKGGRGLRISESHICGLYLLAVPLTEKQSEDIQKLIGVGLVTPNQILHTSDSSDLDDDDAAEIPEPAALGSQFKKRGQLVVDTSAFLDLRSISTPPNSPLSDTYMYYSEAGEGVTAIAVDSGVNVIHDEFVTATGDSPFLQERINAMESAGLQDDYDNAGTCRTSKIVGHTVGVARNAKVLIVKISPEVSSLVDAFVQIINYLGTKTLGGENVKGYHVMSILIQWDNKDERITDRFEDLLSVLIKHYQTVVVVQAGAEFKKPQTPNLDIVQWPATAERRHDIIVVGAAEARSRRIYDFSRAGPFLSVNAPGMVRCARSQGGNLYKRRRGTDVATVQVVGVIAYLLSLPGIGSDLRRDMAKIPQAVKTYIMNDASYKRQEDDYPAIWNRVGA